MSRYAPRTEPKPIPEARWNDAPLNCLEVNTQWVSHMLGALNVLDQQDAWIGDDESVFDARQQVNEIMLALMPGCPKFKFSAYTEENIPTSGNETDDGAVELGITFSTQTYGRILAIKFYKRAENTGTHFGHIWSSTGDLLETVEFTDETESGWQLQLLETPFTLLGCQTVVVSVHMPSGFYSYSRPVFDAPIVATPFQFPVDAGVYNYGDNPTFPSNFFEHSDYFIDVVFESLRFEG